MVSEACASACAQHIEAARPAGKARGRRERLRKVDRMKLAIRYRRSHLPRCLPAAPASRRTRARWSIRSSQARFSPGSTTRLRSKSCSAARPSPASSRPATGIMFRATPASSLPQPARDEADGASCPLRPGRQCRLGAEDRQGAGAQPRAVKAQDADAGPRAQLLRGVVRQHRLGRPRRPAGRPAAATSRRPALPSARVSLRRRP